MAENVVGNASSRVSAGIVLIVAAMLILPFLDAFTKHLGATLPVMEIVWARFTFHLLLLSPYVFYRHGLMTLRPPHPIMQVLRAITLIIATTAFVAALRFLPIADALALFFIAPLVVTMLSPFVLGETVGGRRWLAVLAGFIGTLVIIRPGFATVNAGTFLAIVTGFSFAGYLLFTRKLALASQPLLTTLYTGLVGTVLMSATLPFIWVAPSAIEWMLLIAVGAIAALGHYLIVSAYRYAPAVVLAPFAYCEMVMAVIIGYLWFGDVIDGWTVLGVAILIASGSYISMREGGRRIRRR